MIRGFDASSVQGVIPFWLLSKDMRFGVFKGMQGNDFFDPNFKKNVDGAMAEGIEPFAYGFAYPLPHLDPKAQAKLIVERTLNASRAMEKRPLFLDLEWPSPEQWKRWGCSAKQINEWNEIFCGEVHSLMSIAPIIYTYPWWWAAVSKGTDVSWAAQYALWLASYIEGWPAEGRSPKLLSPWTDWLFWQFDGNNGLRLPNGVDADFCVFNGTEDDLQRLAGKGPPPRPANDSELGDAAIEEVDKVA